MAVPVSHEEVTLEREPTTEANGDDTYDGPAPAEKEHGDPTSAYRPLAADRRKKQKSRSRWGFGTVPMS